MPWWGWALIVWFCTATLVLLFMAGAAKLNREAEQREAASPERMNRNGE